MTLLIVDDEELTRSGIITSIDWETLGITDLLQAEDGLQGLETALSHHPDIILSDVQMPRMDGITMLRNIEKELPDTSVIFMSGYSEKQYLKAAIQLKAVSYIDKPVQASELYEALQEAIKLHHSRLHSHRGQQLLSFQTKADLAYLLTIPPGTNVSRIREAASALSLTLDETTYFTSILVHAAHAIESNEHLQETIYNGLQAFITGLGVTCLFLTRRVSYALFEIIGSQSLSDSLLQAALSYLKSQYEHIGKFYITAGETIQGTENAFLSYNTAVALMQNSFFYPAGSVITAGDISAPSETAAPADTVFEHALRSNDRDAADKFLKALFSYYKCSSSILPNTARDHYFRLFLLLEKAEKEVFLPEDRKETILSSMETCFSYDDLHSVLVDKTEEYFIHSENIDKKQENTTIKLIEQYVEQNYQKEGLSVKDISTHVFLSASYVCTVFKNETGRTLSQYITEFRMEKAKQLLSDPRYKIADISSQVGYSDGNYFGKSFKKYSGMTPSEYRERMTG